MSRFDSDCKILFLLRRVTVARTVNHPPKKFQNFATFRLFPVSFLKFFWFFFVTFLPPGFELETVTNKIYIFRIIGNSLIVYFCAKNIKLYAKLYTAILGDGSAMELFSIRRWATTKELHGSAVTAQLAQRAFQTPENYSSNLVMGNFLSW